MEILKKISSLQAEKKTLQTALNRINAEITSLEETGLNYMIDNGLQSVKINGRTVYLSSQVWASATPEGVAGLKRIGLGEFVTERANVQSLSAYYREVVENAGSLDAVTPPDGVTLTEKFSIRSRKS